MPRLTVDHLEGRGERVGTDEACKWMEEVKEGSEGEPAQSSSNRTPAASRPWQTFWTLRMPRSCRGWGSFALAGAVWSICQAEAAPYPSLLQVDVCWRLLLVCFLWVVLGGGVHALKCCLRPGQNEGEPPLSTQQDAVTRNRNDQYSRMGPLRSSEHDVPLALAFADGLLLCVLQEPLSDASVPHIKSLFSRLESVYHTLEEADVGSEVTPEEQDRSSVLQDKVKLLLNYLQQRMRSLCRLVQVQGDFEASVKDVLEGLDGLWAQLEELHTGVTLTKEGSRDHRDLASAQADVESLITVLVHYKKRLQCCQAHLKDSMQLLQELTWSHTHMSNTVSSSSESVWPELLLQSNIEQFDKVQESFLSVEQQTTTFQAHLEGLGKGNQEGHANHSPVSSQTSSHLHNGRTCNVPLERRNSTSASTSVLPADADAESGPRLSLRERSALRFSSSIGRLRKSGRKK